VSEPGDKIVVTNSEVATEAQAKAKQINSELSKRREILTADQLVSLISPRARFECDFPDLNAYFFTIDGVLNGRKIAGAMFAGECILIFEDNYMKAADLANRGLRETVKLLHEEYETRDLRLSPVAAGLAMDATGRKAKPGDQLQKLPKLRRLLEHLIGGKPWQW